MIGLIMANQITSTPAAGEVFGRFEGRLDHRSCAAEPRFKGRRQESDILPARRAASHAETSDLCDTESANAGDSTGEITTTMGYQPSETKCSSQKVNRNRLSKLMMAILNYVDGTDGVERGELVQYVFGLERRYCGYYSDPCMPPREKREYERRYRRAQPVVSRCLRRLESKGLVHLIRHGRYVKAVALTSDGMAAVHRKTPIKVAEAI